LEIALVQPPDAATNPVIGNQAGTFPLLVIETDDFQKTHDAFKKSGVEFVSEKTDRFYGTEIILKDLYGNLLDLLQAKPHNENK